KTVSGPADPPPVDKVIYDDARVARIPFYEHQTPNPFFNIASDEHMKRMNPKILSITDAQVQFIRGSIAALDIIEDPAEGTMVAVLQGKVATKNRQSDINKILKGGKPRGQPAAAPPPGNVPPPPPAGGGGGG